MASADRERVRRGGFPVFARMALPYVAGVDRPRWNWHLDEMARHVEGVFRSEVFHELLINIPPSAVKSTISSVLFPAYVWTFDPRYRFMAGSYAADNLSQFGRGIMSVVQSRWFAERWGTFALDNNNASHIRNSKGGSWYGATCPGGRSTGKHAATFILDDPTRAADGTAKMHAVNAWINSSVLTRAQIGRTIKLIMPMQRLHEEDASGHVVDMTRTSGTCVQLMLPAKFEVDRRCVTPFGGDQRTRQDEPLWDLIAPNFERVVAASGGWNGAIARTQFQQDPGQGDDQIFKGPFLRFDAAARPLSSTLSCISVDPTFAGREKRDENGRKPSDFVAIEVWGYDAGDYLCFYSEAVRRGFADTCAAIVRVRAMFPTTTIVVEAAANGNAIVETLTAALPGLIVIARPTGSQTKKQRARAASHYFSGGKVRFAADAPWFEAKTRNLVRFPGGANDDDVDTTSQAILHLAEEYGGAGDLVAAMNGWKDEKAQGLGARLVAASLQRYA